MESIADYTNDKKKKKNMAATNVYFPIATAHVHLFVLVYH